MWEDSCQDVRSVVVPHGTGPPKVTDVQDASRAAADKGPPAIVIDIVGLDPNVDDPIFSPHDSGDTLVPVPPATYPDLIPTTWTTPPSDSSTATTTGDTSSDTSSATSTTPPTVSDSTLTEEPTLTSSSTTQEPPEPSETEPSPSPFDPGVCKVNIVEYATTDGFMAKISMYDDSDKLIADNSDSMDFNWEGQLDGHDPIGWGGFYWIYSDALGQNATFTFEDTVVIHQKEEEERFFAFTRWNVVVNIGNEVQWDLSALDQASLPHVSVGDWNYDGSEQFIPVNEAAVSFSPIFRCCVFRMSLTHELKSAVK